MARTVINLAAEKLFRQQRKHTMSIKVIHRNKRRKKTTGVGKKHSQDWFSSNFSQKKKKRICKKKNRGEMTIAAGGKGRVKVHLNTTWGKFWKRQGDGAATMGW